MKIESSAINLSSERYYFNYQKTEAAFIEQRADEAAKLDFSKEGKTKLEQLNDYKEEIEQQKKQEASKRKENALKNMKNMIEAGKTANENQVEFTPEEDYRIQLMKRLIESLRMLRGKDGKPLMKFNNIKSNPVDSDFGKNSTLKFSLTNKNSISLEESSTIVSSGSGANVSSAGRVWTRTTVVSNFVMEKEQTAFEGMGSVVTADGRRIDFNVTLEMSRAFCENNELLMSEDYIVCDPLVINLDTVIPSVTDQKFMFDIDSDGEEENISFAGQGSGFLALDRNNDGVINDGGELFGTKSGDGFADLSELDEDGNGFIDDGDRQFKNLKVWYLDENGDKKLVSAKELGIGAIYTGSADTQFSLNNEEQYTNGFVRKTGIYIKEDGNVGTVNHIDLTL